MKVIKSGIVRTIDPSRLQEFKDKGYKLIEDNPKKKPKKGD